MGACERRNRRWLARTALTLAALDLLCSQSRACEMSLTGKILFITGEIFKGDEFKFRDFLSEIHAKVAEVRLNSPGGNIYASGEIGRQIRDAGLTTLVDARRDICASACTVLFASGKERVYLNARGPEGVMGHEGFRGLGFHQGSIPDQPLESRYSGDGTAAMIRYYYEFGVPAAAGLVDKAPPERIFAVSGASALSMGIATRITDAHIASAN